MDKIIEKLEELKRTVAAGKATTKDVDKINEIIRECEKQKTILDACMNLIPSQEDMLPVPESSIVSAPHIVIEQATIHVYGEYPPPSREMIRKLSNRLGRFIQL